MEKGSIYEVEIEDMSNEGSGIGQSRGNGRFFRNCPGRYSQNRDNRCEETLFLW